MENAVPKLVLPISFVDGFKGWTCSLEGLDSQMIRDYKIMELQELFAAMDPTCQIAFLNLFDKGFKNWLGARLNGQKVLQQVFAQVDNSLSRKDVLQTTGVAVVRSGNERAVGHCKMSWFIKNGTVDHKWNIDMLCDVWAAWTFQVNFLYGKYL